MVVSHALGESCRAQQFVSKCGFMRKMALATVPGSKGGVLNMCSEWLCSGWDGEKGPLLPLLWLYS